MSKLEDDVQAQLEAAVVPPGWQRQYHFAKAIGRRWSFDFAWVAERLAIEVEGGAYILGRHVRGAGFEQDAVKYNYGALTGWRILRFGPAAVRAGIIPQAVRLHIDRWNTTPAEQARRLREFVAASPKPPKKRKPRRASDAA